MGKQNRATHHRRRPELMQNDEGANKKGKLKKNFTSQSGKQGNNRRRGKAGNMYTLNA